MSWRSLQHGVTGDLLATARLAVQARRWLLVDNHDAGVGFPVKAAGKSNRRLAAARFEPGNGRPFREIFTG